jgi:pseudaminic acid cytidylyltransferase
LFEEDARIFLRGRFSKTMRDMRIAVIPARGGSKRIPRKNIRPFRGIPIIAYSVRAAILSQLFDKVIVSTDDSEIAQVANSVGAETPFLRPPELSGDFVGTTRVVKHAIEWTTSNLGNVGTVCCIYATAPFVTARHLRMGLEVLQSNNKSFAFATTSYAFPIQRAIRQSNDGGVEPFFPEYAETRSQDLVPAFHDAGQFYWGQSQAFVDELTTFAPHSSPVHIPRWMVQDIDTEEDWFHAEIMFEALVRQGTLSE